MKYTFAVTYELLFQHKVSYIELTIAENDDIVETDDEIFELLAKLSPWALKSDISRIISIDEVWKVKK